jgi:hypothetical protein
MDAAYLRACIALLRKLWALLDAYSMRSSYFYRVAAAPDKTLYF